MSPRTIDVMSTRTPLEEQPSSAHVLPTPMFDSARRGWALGLLGVALFAAVHLRYPGGRIGESTYLLTTAGAAIVGTVGAQRQPPRLRFPWGCIAVGLTCSAVGDFIFYLLTTINGTVPSVSPADAFWLAAYVALAVGVSNLIVGGNAVHKLDIDGLIDIGSFAVVAVMIVTQLPVVRDIVKDTSSSLFTRTVWTAYPVLDAALLGVIAKAAVSRRLRSKSGLCLTLGVALWLVSDLVSLLIADVSAFSRWLDVGWMVGAGSLAASAWPSSTVDAAADRVFIAARVTDSRLVITLLPLLVPGVIDIWEYSYGQRPNPMAPFVGTLALVVLAFARSTRLVQARNRQEEALERSTRFYAALAENSSDAVIVVDADGVILNDAPNLVTMLGRTGQPTKGMNTIDLLGPPDRDAALRVFARWLSTTGVVDNAELKATQLDGAERWFGVRAANLIDDPVVGGVVINLRDITDRKRAEQELSHNAFHDSLTGLANRELFHDRLEHALVRTARAGLGVAVVYLDLDGFKTVNDSRGHDAGDQVLREVAVRLTSAVRTLDTVSRLGGDEFAILIEETALARDEAETVAERVLQSLTAPFAVDVHSVVLSASIGIAVGDLADTASSMMREADVAMYNAKTSGKGRWALYESAMGAEAFERLELESDLRLALDRRQLRLMYQPVIDLQSGKVVGFEALLRWDHPTRGVISPLTFIPVAESNGSIVPIGQWVLEEACRTAADWHRCFPDVSPTMAVNLSALQIASPDIVDHVAAALDGSGFVAASLILEMTESVLVQDAEIAARRLRELRALGVRLAIDDFGTGYSSLAYLRQFPIDILKIDKSFTDTITDPSTVPPIVRGLLDLAKTLNMKTVAEGIEIDVQRVSLRDQHCEFGQGFLFAEPLNLDEATVLLTRPSVALPTLQGPS